MLRGAIITIAVVFVIILALIYVSESRTKTPPVQDTAHTIWC